MLRLSKFCYFFVFVFFSPISMCTIIYIIYLKLRVPRDFYIFYMIQLCPKDQKASIFWMSYVSLTVRRREYNYIWAAFYLFFTISLLLKKNYIILLTWPPLGPNSASAPASSKAPHYYISNP